MYRRYITVGIVFFTLVCSYFLFFHKKDTDNEYEEFYEKLVERVEFSNYLDDVNINIEEIDDGNSKYSYIVVFDGVNEVKEDVKILVVDENCSVEIIEYFPSFGIIANHGYSLVKVGNEDEEQKKIKGISLVVSNIDKVNNFLIYFSSNGIEQFVKVPVSLN